MFCHLKADLGSKTAAEEKARFHPSVSRLLITALIILLVGTFVWLNWLLIPAKRPPFITTLPPLPEVLKTNAVIARDSKTNVIPIRTATLETRSRNEYLRIFDGM